MKSQLRAARVKSGDQQLRAFEASLTKIIGAEKFPLETVGDLSLLLHGKNGRKRAKNLLKKIEKVQLGRDKKL